MNKLCKQHMHGMICNREPDSCSLEMLSPPTVSASDTGERLNPLTERL